MSFYAPVGNINTLEALQKMGILGEYHLLLAPDVAKMRLTYQMIFHSKGWHIILDNGAAEGDAVTGEELLILGNSCGANIIIVPDVFEDKEKTIGLAEDFFKELKSADRARYHWMLVPQGKTLGEAKQCIVDLVDIIGKTSPIFWGIPYHFVEKLGSREELVKCCRDASSWTIGDNIHLLGMSDDYNDDVACTRMKGVMGIDSANPIILGLAGKHLASSDYRKEPRGNYMDESHQLDIIVKENIQKLRSDITVLKNET